MIHSFGKDHNEKMPRTYCRTARKEYLNFAKPKRPGRDKIHKVIGGQLQYILRDLGYIEGFFAGGYTLRQRDLGMLFTIQELYT